MLAALVPSADIATEVILKAKEKGLILFWLLFETKAIRITPPLTISNGELLEGIGIIIEILNTIDSK